MQNPPPIELILVTERNDGEGMFDELEISQCLEHCKGKK